jgi:hypothetical protein
MGQRKDKYLDDCPICKEYKNLDDPSQIENLIWHGEFKILGELYTCVVIPSRKWSVSQEFGGSEVKHWIFTTFSHHVGKESQGIRAELNKIATIVAFQLLGEDYRLTNNSGEKTSTLRHYHAHFVDPGEQRIVREVANVMQVIQNARKELEFDLPEEVIEKIVDYFDKGLLQQMQQKK